MSGDDQASDPQPRKGGGRKRHKRQQHKVAMTTARPAVSSVPLPLPPGGVEIDGSLLEGGGQILRNASALSAIVGLPIKVDKIRAGRDKPGLRPQHLTGLQLIEALCSGRLEGGEVGTSCITLHPGRLVCGRHVADTQTAGSCMLLAQSALPCLLYAAAAREGALASAPASAPVAAAAAAGADTSLVAAPAAAGASDAGCDAPADAATSAVARSGGGDAAMQAALQSGTASQLDLRGGTDASMAPPAGYMQHVLLPMLRSRLGVHVEMDLLRRGFFPRGQGRVLLLVQRLPPGACLPAIDLTIRGEITGILIRAFTAGKLVPTIGERLAAAAHKEIKSRMPRCGVSRNIPISLEVVHEPAERAFGDGCGILITAQSSTGCVLGASGLGERGVPAEEIGARAADELMDALSSGACVDEWLQDQLIIFMALAKGRSRVLTGQPTLHTRTACMVAQTLIGATFSIQPKPGSSALWVVECEGAGLVAPDGREGWQ